MSWTLNSLRQMKLNSVQELVELLETLDSLGYPVPFANYASQLERNGFTKHISHYEVKLVHSVLPNDCMQLVFSSRKEHLRYTMTLEKGLI